jgi:hypothetical protein
MMRIVYCDGVYLDATLRAIGRDRHWVDKQIRQYNLTHDKVFFLMADDADNVRIQQK